MQGLAVLKCNEDESCGSWVTRCHKNLHL